MVNRSILAIASKIQFQSGIVSEPRKADNLVYRSLKIAVVIPAFNESLHIGKTVESVPAYVDHIVIVDDGSCDETASLAAKAEPRKTGSSDMKPIVVSVRPLRRDINTPFNWTLMQLSLSVQMGRWNLLK